MKRNVLKWSVAGLPVLALVHAMGAGASQPVASYFPLEAPQDSLGKAVYTGKGNCHVCHGVDAKGGPLGPNLTDAEWLHIDGKVESIADLVKKRGDGRRTTPLVLRWPRSRSTSRPARRSSSRR
jgi:mono/diheme cytochrome c family protein